jgi:hypothetical protein
MELVNVQRLRRLVPAAILLSIASSAPAQTPPSPSPSQTRGHREILDVLLLAAAAGAVAGRADGYCRGTSFEAGPVIGTTALMAVLSIGGSPNAYERRHPEIEGIPQAATTLVDLKARSDWRARVEIIERGGQLTAGELTDITDDAVALQTAHGPRTISQASIAEINSVERDRIWDTPIFGAGVGVAWGLLWSHDCSLEDAVTLPPRGRMMILGGVVLGVATLVVDILHKKRTALFRKVQAADMSRVRVSPVMVSNGIGVQVSFVRP